LKVSCTVLRNRIGFRKLNSPNILNQ